jgi:chromosomal replication initiation ATPase DnaA
MPTHPKDLDLAAFIIQTVCVEFHLETIDLESPERTERLVWPRWLAIYLIDKYTHMDRRVLGHLFNRSQNSVRAVIQRLLPVRLETDKRCLDKLFQLETYVIAYIRRPSVTNVPMSEPPTKTL